MVLLTLMSKANRHLATPLLRSGLSLRVFLGGGVIRPNPYLDYISFVPWAQRLVAFEVQSKAKQIKEEQQKEPTAFDKFVDVAWDRLFENASNAISPPPPPSTTRKQQYNNPRLEALETFLRPALVPNERWADISRWQFNTRFVKWARMEYLSAKYGEDVKRKLALPKYRELSSVLSSSTSNSNASAVNGRIISASPPPSASTLVKAFNMKNWTREKNSDAVSDRMRAIVKDLGGRVIPIPGSAILFPNVPGDADVSSLSLEDILEVAGGHVSYCGPFNVVCEQAGLYEFWTREYINGLASYLLERADEFDGGDTVVLDVGAGDGMLVHFLRDALDTVAASSVVGVKTAAAHRRSKRGGDSKQKAKKKKRGGSRRIPTVIATDDGSWKIRPRFSVERLNVKDAIAKYRETSAQLIVLCSWMPMSEDWTADMRRAGADEIILVGECDDGNCGDNWATWGNSEFCEEGRENEPHALYPPQYEIDGYTRHDLEQLSRLQFSRFDSSVSSNSKSISFRRPN